LGRPKGAFGVKKPGSQQGEKIDFFMSHSWKDDPEAKFRALEGVVDRFKRKHGRFPTLWIDKCCIDQENITDGLKVLPINVMECRQMLVLCGPTYAERLWCVWELFTLFAFASKGEAQRSVEFVPFGAIKESVDANTDASPMGALISLKSFSLANAHCFDPNEEGRLREIISARGASTFESRIRELAVECEAAMLRRKRSSSIRMSSMLKSAKDTVRHVGGSIGLISPHRGSGGSLTPGSSFDVISPTTAEQHASATVELQASEGSSPGNQPGKLRELGGIGKPLGTSI